MGHMRGMALAAAPLRRVDYLQVPSHVSRPHLIFIGFLFDASWDEAS